MATATLLRRIGPSDHGLAMSFEDFGEADFEDGYLYELARGIVVVTEIPGINHGRIVMRITTLFVQYDLLHPGVINYRAGGGECRIRLPGMVCDRHPDQAVYLKPPPEGPSPWTRWVPEIVVEIVSKGGVRRDFAEKREEYLRAGVLEYWIVDPRHRSMKVHFRAGDVWEELSILETGVHRTHLLPGLEVHPGALIGPA